MFNLLGTILIFMLIGITGILIHKKQHMQMLTIKRDNLREYILYLSWVGLILTMMIY